ncbi:hypothetical protein JCM10449v2_006790, partial [Rhodotorula kratochvilovae]
MFTSPWLSRRRPSASSSSASAKSPSPASPPPPLGAAAARSPTLPASPPPSASTHAHRRRRSIAVQRDLFAGGERDAVRCRAGALDGLDEILALAPPPSSSFAGRRPSAPAFSFAAPSSAAAFGLPAGAAGLPRRHSLEPRASAARALLSPPLRPLGVSPPPPRARAGSIAGGVKRKPVPRDALEEDVEMVSSPAWDGRAEGPEPERAIEERVRRMSVEDAMDGCGLGIGIGDSPATSPPPASPMTLSSAASSSLSRSTTLSSTSASSASHPPSAFRPFALVRKQVSRPTSAHEVILGGRAVPRTSDQVDDELVDAWMDLIAGRGDADIPSRSAFSARVAPSAPPAQAMRSAPQPFAPDVLAHLANALPPLVYTATPPPAPVPPCASTVPSPADLAPSAAPSPRAGSLVVPPIPAPASPQNRHRLSLVAPSMHGSDTASEEYHSAVEGDAFVEGVSVDPVDPALLPAAAPRTRELRKRSSSVLRSPRDAPPRLSLSLAASSDAFDPPPLSPTSPVQPEQKRRLLSSSASAFDTPLDKPLPPRPPRPPKSAARRSISIKRPAGLAEALGAAAAPGPGEGSSEGEMSGCHVL